MDWNLIISILGYVLAPVTGAVTWIVSKHQRTNDAIAMLQATINTLVEKNTELTEKMIAQNSAIIELKKSVAMLTNENITLKEGQTRMISELAALRKENRELKSLIQSEKRKKNDNYEL